MMRDPSPSIEQSLQEATQRIRRSTRRGWIFIAALVIGLSCWLSWLHGRVAEVDATVVVELAETKARTALPAAAERLQQHLEEAAPGLIGQVSERVLESPVLLREHIVKTADTWIQEMSTDVEQALAAMPAGIGELAVAELDVRYRGLPREEQMHRLLEDFAREVRLRVARVLTGPMDIYGGTLANIESEIGRLGDPTGLTKRELLHREILITAIQLTKYEGPEQL